MMKFGKWRTGGIIAVVLLIIFIILFSDKIVWVIEETSDKTGRNHCDLPLEGYKAWTTGTVTTLGVPIVKDCSKIIAGDKKESDRVQTMYQRWLKTFKRYLFSNEAYTSLLQQSSNCTWLKENLTNNLYNTKLERDFPIAYIFLVYESPLQFLRLFKILYKPQNSYCIHVDETSPHKEFYYNIIQCLDNVIAPSELFNVRWGHFSMLQAQMQCFKDLMKLRERQRKRKKWNYVLNLCSKELPLHSTKEMVQMMQSMNGTSSVVAWLVTETDKENFNRLRGGTIPFNLKYYKSMAYNALSVDFAKFMVKDYKAQELYQFFLKTSFPEEHFYPVLFHMPGAPGGYNPDIPKNYYFEVGHYFWRITKAELALSCFGVIVHGICIVNHADLPLIMQDTKNGATALFQNKYFMEQNHVVMDCMEEMIVAKNKLEYEEDCHT